MAKNLTNCNLKEFMVQTRLIKYSVEKWLKETDILNIRKSMPKIPDDTPDDKRAEILRKQSAENLSRMFDAIFDEHPDETVQLIALMCFVPVSEIEEHPVSFYLQSVTEMLNDKIVWDFFSSLVIAARRLGVTTA